MNAQATTVPRRPVPEREHPLRNLASALRHPDPQSGDELGQPGPAVGGSLSTPEDVVVYGVKVGYRVVEEQLKRGQRAAKRLRSASIRAGTGDYGRILNKTLSLYGELGRLLVEVAELAMQTPDLLPGLRKWLGKKTAGANAEPPAAASSALAGSAASAATLEVVTQLLQHPQVKALLDALSARDGGRAEQSSPARSEPAQPTGFAFLAAGKRVQIELLMQADARDGSWRIPALCTMKTGDPAAKGIALEIKSGRPDLQLDVSGLKPDMYVGVIVDAKTAKPVGTIELAVADAAAR